MIIQLKRLPNKLVFGIYDGRMAERLRLLAPGPAASYMNDLADVCVVSDMYRDANGSLVAVKRKKGALPPSRSNHNYGRAIDIDIDATTAKLKAKMGWPKCTKQDLDMWMEQRGWYCHRRDHKNQIEAWHYNFLGVGYAISSKVKSTFGYAEAELQKTYGGYWKVDLRRAQALLQELKLYNYKVDGVPGEHTKMALTLFQRTWALPVTGKLDARTMRTLVYVTADYEITDF